LDKLIGDLIPPDSSFSAWVGAGGLGASLWLLYLLLSFGKMQFLTAQAITTFVAMTANFLLNNSMTYRDRRLRGRRLWIGLITFYAACFVGAVVNLSGSGVYQGRRFLPGIWRRHADYRWGAVLELRRHLHDYLRRFGNCNPRHRREPRSFLARKAALTKSRDLQNEKPAEKQ